MKAFRQTNNEKCFINICTSDGIPSPEDITAVQLTVILSSETPSNYKVPMSITELRLTPDKSGKDAIVCDVAIHPDFFRKVEALNIFRDFLITIIFEALDTKYDIQINRESWIILKNRKSMGVLVKHRVQNRDVQKVCDSYQNPTKDQKTLMNELKIDSSESNSNALISEIDPKTAKIVEESKHLQKSTKSVAKPAVNQPSKDEPTKPTKISKNFVDFCMTKTFKGYPCGCAMVEFLLPNVISPDEIMLDLGRDRIVLEVGCAEYYFEAFFPFQTDVGKATSEFNRTSRVSYILMKKSDALLVIYPKKFNE